MHSLCPLNKQFVLEMFKMSLKLQFYLTSLQAECKCASFRHLPRAYVYPSAQPQAPLSHVAP